MRPGHCRAITTNLMLEESGGNNREVYMAKHSARYIQAKTKQQTTGENPQGTNVWRVIHYIKSKSRCASTDQSSVPQPHLSGYLRDYLDLLNVQDWEVHQNASWQGQYPDKGVLKISVYTGDWAQVICRLAKPRMIRTKTPSLRQWLHFYLEVSCLIALPPTIWDIPFQDDTDRVCDPSVSL